MAAGAVVAAGSVVAGGLLLSQPSSGQQPVVDAERGSYPGEGAPGAPEALPPADTLLGGDPLGAPGSAFSATFPDLAAAATAGTIPATGAGDVTPAGSNGAPPSAVPPAAGGGAPPAAPAAADSGSRTAGGGGGGGGAESAARSGGADTGEGASGGGPIGNTVDTVSDVGAGAVETVSGAATGLTGGLL